MRLPSDDLDHTLRHTQGGPEELRGQHIFITGGTGFRTCWPSESSWWANGKLRLDAFALILTHNRAAFRI